MKVVFERPRTLLKKPFTYCPGCHHGLAQRLIAEVIDELGIGEITIGVGLVARCTSMNSSMSILS